jgi:hypothetical protein
VAESRAELPAGRFVIESPERHVARVQALIARDTLHQLLAEEKIVPLNVRDDDAVIDAPDG